MTPKRGRGRPKLPPTVRVDLYVPRALDEQLRAAAAARRTSIKDAYIERLEAAEGEDARRGAYLAGYRAGVREAAARVEALSGESRSAQTGDDVMDKVECPGPDCLACNGGACGLCGAGCWNPSAPYCEHDVIERHESPQASPPPERADETKETQ